MTPLLASDGKAHETLIFEHLGQIQHDVNVSMAGCVHGKL